MTNLDRWRKHCEDYESPEIFITWGFYALIASALKRRVWYDSDPLTGLPTHRSIFLNQFIVLVGPPACGKSRIVKNVKAFCEDPRNVKVLKNKGDVQIGATNAITCTPDNITFEGFFEFMGKQERTEGVAFEPMINGKATKKIYAHNSVTACLEELGVMFTKNAMDVSSFLCQAYDAGNMHRYTKTQGKDEIKNACVNFIAGTTTDALKDMLAEGAVEQGLCSRIIFVYADRPRKYQFLSKTSEAQQVAYNELLDHVNKLATETIGEVRLSPEAEKFMREYYESKLLVEINRVNHDKKLDHYYGRKKLHWMKLAAVMHFAEHRDNMIVTLDEAKEALKLLDLTDQEMHLTFRNNGRNEQHETAIQIITMLKNSPDKQMSYKKLFLAFFKDGNRAYFDEVLTFLMVTDQITQCNGVIKYKQTCEIL